MFLGLCAVLVIAAVPLTGGKLSRLGQLEVRAVRVALAALLLQVVVMSVWPTMPAVLAILGHLVSYVMLGYFVWVNRALPGIFVMALGAGCNALAITINGGTLPASAAALRKAGIHEHAGFDNSNVVAHPHLAWLGDIWATPAWLPLRNVVSIGDVILVLGAAVLVMRATHASRPKPRLSATSWSKLGASSDRNVALNPRGDAPAQA